MPFRRVFGSSDNLTRLASSSNTHSLWVVIMTLTPERTAAASVSDKLHLHLGMQVRLRFLDDEQFTGEKRYTAGTGRRAQALTPWMMRS